VTEDVRNWDRRTLARLRWFAIMNKLRQIQLSLLAGLCLATGPAFGAMTFNFSYQFVGGPKVTGSLDGDQNGEFVENVSNVSVFFNGTAMNGTVYTAKLDSTINWVAGAVVSFDVLKNNFIFANGDLLRGASIPEYFEIMSRPPYTRSFAAARISGYYEEETTATSLWSLTPAVVPEPSTYIAGALLLLPFGAQAVRRLRNRKH
jgi:hypothetical protein